MNYYLSIFVGTTAFSAALGARTWHPFAWGLVVTLCMWAETYRQEMVNEPKSGPWKLEADEDGDYDVVMTRKNGRKTTIILPWHPNEREAVAVRNALNKIARPVEQ